MQAPRSRMAGRRDAKAFHATFSRASLERNGVGLSNLRVVVSASTNAALLRGGFAFEGKDVPLVPPARTSTVYRHPHPWTFNVNQPAFPVTQVGGASPANGLANCVGGHRSSIVPSLTRLAPRVQIRVVERDCVEVCKELVDKVAAADRLARALRALA
jgi:hypothetical protein